MEKRLVIFVICSALILFGYQALMQTFFPPPPQAEQVAEEVDQPDAAGKDDASAKVAEVGAQNGATEGAESEVEPDPAATTSPAENGKSTDASAANAEEPAAAETDSQPELPIVPQQWVMLGSYDASSPYQLMVTLTNRGASVERVELVERRANGKLRYRDLDSQTGYAGFHCRDTANGCVVSAVGPGTPAALAEASGGAAQPGILSGDLILSVDGASVGFSAELEALFHRAPLGQVANVTVRRSVEGADKELIFAVALGDRPLELIHPEATEVGSAVPSYLLGLQRLGTQKLPRGRDELSGLPSLRTANWELLESNIDGVAFRFVIKGGADNPGGLEIVKRYRLSQGKPLDADASEASAHAGYNLQVSIELKNPGKEPQTVAYALDGPNGLPIEGWWYTTKIHPSWGSAGARDVIWRVQENKHSLRSAMQIYKEATEKDRASAMTSILTDSPTSAERTLDYLGMDTQYFSAVMMGGLLEAPQPLVCQQAYAMPVGAIPELPGNAMKTLNTSYRFVSQDEALEPGATAVHQYHMFLGPKVPAVLDEYGLADIMEYGWFGWVAKPLSKVLHFFYAMVRNYGLAIILLTVLVRGAMFPIGRKAARNAQMMQALAPELKKIKEKYKGDIEKQTQAQRDLWKKHNFNPLGGCWLMFLQLPIFIGLYRCLSVDIELRQAALIPGIQWCSNLAGPDQAWYWKGILPGFLGSETGWLGPYLNIFPIITIILFIWQQKMFTPPATDEQTQMQQNMMKYMMIVMGVMFFKVPAGLCVYFIASSLWGIGERKMLPPPSAAPIGDSAPAPTPTNPSVADKPERTWWERLTDRSGPKESVDEIRARRKSRR